MTIGPSVALPRWGHRLCSRPRSNTPVRPKLRIIPPYCLIHDTPERRPMTRFLGAALAVALIAVPARADDKDATPILDKAIKALGGEPALAKVLASASWKLTGKVSFDGNESEFTTRA